MSMKPKLRGALAAAALAAAGAGAAVFLASTASAHHSFSAFVMDETHTVTGKVKTYEWTNPHTWLWIAVADDAGEETLYGFEGMSPNFLGRRGWSRDMFTPDEEVTVAFWPLRSGEPGGMLQQVTLSNGETMVNFGARGGGGE